MQWPTWLATSLSGLVSCVGHRSPDWSVFCWGGGGSGAWGVFLLSAAPFLGAPFVIKTWNLEGPHLIGSGPPRINFSLVNPEQTDLGAFIHLQNTFPFP